jgi:uncharacterized protein YcbX
VHLDLLALRRYPVKAMAGESLTSVALDRRGLVGDRWFAVVDAEGGLASHKTSRRFRRRDAIVCYRAATGRDGVVRVSRNGGTWSVGERALDDDLTATLGARVAIRPEAAVPHQDGGAVSLVGSATLRWCQERWGVDADPRRLRVNLVVETSEPFEEESWLGRTVEVGDAALRVVQRIERCRTIDLAQDGLDTTTAWLRPLGAERDLQLAVYADVVRPGTLEVVDAGR